MPRLLRLALLSPAHYRVRPAALAAGVGAAALVVARRIRRLEVRGHSMLPTLQPGDRVLSLRGRRARPGDLVVVPDPRTSDRLVVKRVVVASAGGVTVRGDNPAASTDSRQFGTVPVDSVRGRVVYRYAPEHRRGRIGRLVP